MTKKQWFQKLFKECFNQDCKYESSVWGLTVNNMYVFVDKAKNVSVKFKGGNADTLGVQQIQTWLDKQGIKAEVKAYTATGSGYCSYAGMPTVSIRGLKDYPWHMC